MEFYNANLQAKERLKRYYLEAEHVRTIASLKLETPKSKKFFSNVALNFYRILFSTRESRGGEHV
jgi:hypothetical protein